MRLEPLCRRRMIAVLGASAFGAMSLAEEPKKLDPQKPSPKTTEKAPPKAKVVEKPPAKAVRYAWFPRFSPDSKTLLTAHGTWSGNEGGDALLWDVESGEIRRNMPQPRGIRSVAWSPQGDFYVIGGYGRLVRMYDAVTGRQTGEFQTEAQVEGVRVLAEGKVILTTEGNGDLTLWSAKTKESMQRFAALHQRGIWGVEVSYDEKFVATAGQDKHVRIVDLKTNEMVHDIEHPRDTNGVAFSHDNRFLATGCGDSIIRLIDVESGKVTKELKGHKSGTVSDLRFSSDDKLLASSGGDGTVRLWDFADPENPRLQETLEAHTQMCFGVDLSPDGKWLASAGWDHKVNVWELSSLKQLWSKTRTA